MGTHRSHQCQGFHATPANTPTLWGGSSSSTKYPNDSSRPPTPSFPPYDVRTLHFVACGRPWLLHWRMGTGRRDDDDATTRACAPHGIFCKGLWPLAGARTSSKEFEVRAKVAREAPMDRNVEKPLVFERFSESARVDFQIFWMRKSYVFICFLDIAS